MENVNKLKQEMLERLLNRMELVSKHEGFGWNDGFMLSMFPDSTPFKVHMDIKVTSNPNDKFEKVPSNDFIEMQDGTSVNLPLHILPWYYKGHEKTKVFVRKAIDELFDISEKMKPLHI